MRKKKNNTSVTLPLGRNPFTHWLEGCMDCRTTPNTIKLCMFKWASTMRRNQCVINTSISNERLETSKANNCKDGMDFQPSLHHQELIKY
jgi:hypothetical protein